MFGCGADAGEVDATGFETALGNSFGRLHGAPTACHR